MFTAQKVVTKNQTVKVNYRKSVLVWLISSVELSPVTISVGSICCLQVDVQFLVGFSQLMDSIIT